VAKGVNMGALVLKNTPVPDTSENIAVEAQEEILGPRSARNQNT
jgi:hypothetical protein